MSDQSVTCISSRSSRNHRRRIATYQEYAGHVQEKGNGRVEEQHAKANVRGSSPRELRQLLGNGHEEIHGRTDRSKVIEPDQRIHPHSISAQQHLNHDDADCLKDDAAHLVHEANKGEMNLTDRGERYARHYPQDIEKGCQVGLGNSPCPGGEEHSHGGRGLEHLNKRHGEIKIDDIGANERARIEYANGNNGSAV